MPAVAGGAGAARAVQVQAADTRVGPGAREDDSQPEAARSRSATTRDPDVDEDDLLADVEDFDLAPLEESESAPEAGYDDDEENGDEAAETLEKAVESAPEPEVATEVVVEKPKPRRRCAIVAHADRNSIMAAILLARDVRLVEGFWIYPQEDLMTFFRGVATDLRDDTPIWVVGFRAHPARDSLQAASLHWEPDELPDEAGWRELQDLLASRSNPVLVWEGEPLPEIVARLRGLGVTSVVYSPASNRPADMDFLEAMRAGTAALRGAAGG